MIFYFTGTGNSLYVAKRIAEACEEELINIADAVKSKSYSYELKEGERVGFVFPVYFGGIPNIVDWFVGKLKLTGPESDFVFSVITNGGSPAAADQMIAKKVEAAGLPYDVTYAITMPDNYVVLYDVPDEEKADQILADAEKELEVILDEILTKECGELAVVPYESTAAQRFLTAAMYPLYRSGRKTDKFWVDDLCIGCGACVKRCPCNAIELVDGVPTWVKDRCVFCLGCTNRCGAIQYGKGTVKRNRYKHPLFRKKKHAEQACH